MLVPDSEVGSGAEYLNHVAVMDDRAGYYKIDGHDLYGAVVHLLYDGSTSRVATWRNEPRVAVHSDTAVLMFVNCCWTRPMDSGSNTTYVGPIRVHAPGICIERGGTANSCSDPFMWARAAAHRHRIKPVSHTRDSLATDCQGAEIMVGGLLSGGFGSWVRIAVNEFTSHLAGTIRTRIPWCARPSLGTGSSDASGLPKPPQNDIRYSPTEASNRLPNFKHWQGSARWLSQAPIYDHTRTQHISILRHRWR
ncbi:MAG: uncharacterized protein JWN03_7034 [Nocardia sp.]|nr:uncharacterized protein [Nocardia sp.]